MKNSRLFKNSFSAIGQVVITGGTYFVLYAYLLQTLGVKLLGVWSLIISSTSLALIANFGISTSIVKFVSAYNSRGDQEGLRKLVFTSAIFIVWAYLVISVILFFVGPYILPSFISEKKYLDISIAILPFSLVSLVFNALGGVLSGCLDGLQKNYVRSYIMSASSLFLVLASVALAPVFGLKGLVIAQIVQGILVVLVTMFFVSRFIPGAFNLSWNWSHLIFREIIGYGLKMQSLSLMQMSFEPVTKALLSKYGGLASVGYYEMANRLVSQLRSLIVSGNQVVIPIVAEAKENNESFIKELYVKSFSIILFLNILLTTAIILAIPLISVLWIGKLQPFFNYAVILSTLAVFVNISSNPAYFSYMGEGKLNWLIFSYIGVTVVNCVIGYLGGKFFGGYGVVAAWNLAYLVGSAVILISYHSSQRIWIPSVISRGNLLLMIAAGALCYFGYWFQIGLFFGVVDYFWATLTAISLLVFGWFVLRNSDFRLIIAQLRNYLPSKKRSTS